MISDELSAIRAKVQRELTRRPECFITHPTEVGVLQQLTREEIENFAHENGWRMVSRLGGRQYQFYNDTFERMLNQDLDFSGGGTRRE
ncbi:MAG TPA: hypothetical protein VF551_03880 [Chthoniobacterales bacterium]